MTLRPVHYITLILLTFFIDCRQKKLFKNVTISGRLVNYYTKEPIADISVELRGNDVHSQSTYAIGATLLTSETTDNSGRFVLKSKQSKDHPQYYLRHKSSGGYSLYDFSFKVNSNNYELGDVPSGTYTFKVYLRFLSATNNCAFVDLPTADLNLLSGKDTTIQMSFTKNYNDFISSQLSGLSLTTKNCQTQSVINTTIYSYRLDTVDNKTILITY
ncbi:MAG: hypothetical protein HYX39_10605 [Bacteroidetes bacterium]|nr:hypothetical protein [Bacteroidota bacterium]